MNSFFRMILMVIILVMLAGCQTANGDNAITPAPEDQTTVATTYPMGTTFELESIYPSGEAPGTQVPEYMLPGFTTATPDPELAPIVISEVRHEENVEVIVIKNISNQEIDISAYMIFSPEMGDRKILANNIRLSSGETYELYNGENLEVPQEQIWLTKAVLNNPLDEIWLLNSAARIVYFFTYYPSISE